jgi:hypothetical protein
MIKAIESGFLKKQVGSLEATLYLAKSAKSFRQQIR